MKTANAELIKGIFSGLKLTAAWIGLASASFGMQVGKMIWKPQDEFYPFSTLVWGAVTVAFLFGGRGALTRLTYAVPLADAEATRSKTREYLVVSFGIACASFCFGVCLVGSKRAGELCIVAAVASGALLVLIAFLMRRTIKRLAAFVAALGTTDEAISLPVVNNTNL